LPPRCGNGVAVGGNLDFYSISGGTVAYFCNFSSQTNNCYASERQESSADITGVCGAYNGGWEVVDSRACQYGYERQPKNNFCGRGTGG